MTEIFIHLVWICVKEPLHPPSDSPYPSPLIPTLAAHSDENIYAHKYHILPLSRSFLV